MKPNKHVVVLPYYIIKFSGMCLARTLLALKFFRSCFLMAQRPNTDEIMFEDDSVSEFEEAGGQQHRSGENIDSEDEGIDSGEDIGSDDELDDIFDATDNWLFIETLQLRAAELEAKGVAERKARPKIDLILLLNFLMPHLCCHILYLIHCLNLHQIQIP